ncbi:hypothetical protein F7725_007421 [Dissostichus mawsoni]|uniref:Endonuclease/exonuclease/phosphatase domain-containing protein n=1 Tax=Dissostichus mawsoni TaxID=36200 RepID=A0A7J5XYD7_DISMA|nr:hypothetical protein F7725_007421 [Dissostichus mawsoni]
MVNWHLDSSPSRSPSCLAVVRAKGGGCNLAPHQWGCVQSWQEPYQILCFSKDQQRQNKKQEECKRETNVQPQILTLIQTFRPSHSSLTSEGHFTGLRFRLSPMLRLPRSGAQPRRTSMDILFLRVPRPSERGGDRSTPSNALMRCRRPFVMGTFNACTVREEARLVELAHCAEERGVEILGIQEHRRVHTDDRIVYRRVERCTFITASAWRNEAQAATGGVGLMLGPLARKALRRVYHHTDRILIAEFSGNPVTAVIVVYSPTNVAPSEEVEKFYEDLATAVRDVPAHNFLAILGDFNARLGPEDAPYPYHDSTNRNGAYLMALLMEHELLAANTMYTEEVRKRFRQLDKGAEPSSEYRRFVVANEEATRLCVPVLDRARTSLRSRHPEVVAARGRVEEARLNFELNQPWRDVGY